MGGDLGWLAMSPEPRRWRAREAERLGLEYGYPQCCLDQFVEDIRCGRLPAMLRGWVPTEDGEGRYVPCSACCESMGRVYAE